MRRLVLFALSILTLAGAATAPLAAAQGAVLPFIADDYPQALAEARAKKLPIFLEAWAPWCHSCRSMQAYVYTDAKLTPYAGRFVWLAIDTEKAVNAPTIAKFPIGAWPSMYVIDPATETVAYRWTGGATIEQLTAFLDEAAPKAAAPAGESGLARADRLYGAGDYAAAAAAYAAALPGLESGSAAYARAADAWVFSLTKEGRDAECAAAAREILPKLDGRPSTGLVVSMGLDCAVSLPAEAPGRAAAIADLEGRARSALTDARLKLPADDLSGLYISILGARDDAGDVEGRKRVVADWIALLEGAAAAAKSPAARAVFDSHRLSAYLEAGQPERAIPMLEASERDFPDDYNPPARLAAAYQAMKKHDLALAASDRALARAYGPRRLGILRTRARIQVAAGDSAAAKATLAKAIAECEALPAAQRSDRTLAAIKKELAALEAPVAS